MSRLIDARPANLNGVVGQRKVNAALAKFAANPCPNVFLFSGPTGVGKTCAAYALAGELGCDLDSGAFGGVWEIPSGSQTADSVREAWDRLSTMPFAGSGWKVLIVNECDRVTPLAEMVWLDMLEHLPPKSVIVFTTNAPEKLSGRFKGRCMELKFLGKGVAFEKAARSLIERLCPGANGQATKALKEATDKDGNVSIRAALQFLEAELLSRDEEPQKENQPMQEDKPVAIIRPGKYPENVEVAFPSIPPPEVRTELKAAGFHYNGKERCWWGKKINLPARLNALMPIQVADGTVLPAPVQPAPPPVTPLQAPPVEKPVRVPGRKKKEILNVPPGHVPGKLRVTMRNGKIEDRDVFTERDGLVVAGDKERGFGVYHLAGGVRLDILGKHKTGDAAVKAMELALATGINFNVDLDILRKVPDLKAKLEECVKPKPKPEPVKVQEEPTPILEAPPVPRPQEVPIPQKKSDSPTFEELFARIDAL